MKEQLKIYENIDRMNNEIGKIRIDEKLYAKTLNMKSLAEKYGLIYDENLDETLKNLRVIKEKLEKIRKNKKLDEYVDVEPQSEDGLLQCMRENETYKKYLQISDDIEEVKEYIKKLDILDRYYLLENQYKKEKELLELESKLDPGLIPVKDLNKALLEQEQRNNFIRILNQYDMKYNEEVVTDIQFRIFLEKESEYYRYLIPIPSKSRDEELENINHKIMISSLKLYECPNCKKTLQYTDLGLKLCDFEPLIHEDYDELIKIRNDIIIDIDKRKKFMEWKKNQKLTENFSSDEDFIEFLSSETVPESLKNIRYIEYIKDPRINHESYLSLKKIKNMKHMEKKDIQAYEELRKEYIKIKDLIPKLKNLSFLEKIPINLEKYKRGIEKAKLGDYEIVNETEEELLDKYVDVPEHLIYLDPTIIYEKKELDRLRDELIGLNRMIKMRRNEIKIIDMEIPDNFSDDEFFSDKFYEIKLDRIEYIEIRNTRKEIEKSILYQDLTNKIDHKYTENDLIIVSDKSLAIDMIEKRKKLESNKSNEMRVKLLHDKKNRISYDLKNLFLDETLEYRIQKLKDKIEEEEKQKKINEKVLSYIEEKNKKNKDEEKIIQINENINNLNELKIIAINTEYKYLQNIIDIINENIKEMTSDLFDDHINIKINLFKILKSQKYKPQINLTINYRGSDYDNINQLSGGESARISLIITMALNKFNKFPFLLLDESMASFDDNLRESSLRTLKKHISKGILCINHSETEGNYDNIIRI